MCVPYGITAIGMRESLMEAAREVAGTQAYSAAKFLTYRLQEAMQDVAGGPRLVLAYLA